MIINELSPLASVNNNMIADVIKQQLGERTIDLFKTWKSDSLNQGKRQRVGGFLNFLAGGLREVVMSNFSQITMGSAMTLYTFDWNQSDAQIQEKIKATETAIYGAAGRLAGTGAVRMLGLQATKKVRNLYPQINPEILLDIDDDNRDEIKSAINGMINTMRNSLQQQAVLTTYMSGRKLFGYQDDKKGEDGKPPKPREPWILSEKLEDFAESSKDKNLKAFFSNLKEEAEDSLFDMGYMMAAGVENQYRMNQVAAMNAQGEKRLIRFTPDISNPEVYTFVQGREEAVKNAINTARLGAVHLSDKDVGMISMVGISSAMKADLSERKLTVTYYDGINGSTRKVDKPASKKTIVIPNIKRTINWQDMKDFLKPINSGPVKMTAKLSDGHHLIGFFSTESEGRSWMRPVIEKFCKASLVGEIQPSAIPADVRKRLPLSRFEAASATLFVQDTTTDEAKIKYIHERDGKGKRVKSIRIKLNSPKGKPEGIDQAILTPFGETL
jgi:hypothetical protein